MLWDGGYGRTLLSAVVTEGCGDVEVLVEDAVRCGLVLGHRVDQRVPGVGVLDCGTAEHVLAYSYNRECQYGLQL